MNRRWFPLIALAILAACQDQPTQPDALKPQFHEEGEDDFHFGETHKGTHLRLGHLYWKKTGPQTVEFTFIMGIRRSSNGSAANLGGQSQLASISMGDNTTKNPTFTTTFVDVANDFVEARAVFTHTYPGTGPYEVQSNGCCRISTSAGAWHHPNNPDQSVRYATTVNLNYNGSAASGLPGMVTCPINDVCNFNVVAAVPQGLDLRYRFATQAESGVVRQPGPPQAPSAATIDPLTGVYSWNTTGALVTSSSTQSTVYSTAVVLEGRDPATDVVVTRSMIDFFVRLANIATNAPPAFSAPSPADGTTYTLNPGQTLNLTLQGSDANSSDVVTLGVLGLPAGATFQNAAPTNPASATFSFTPTTAQAGQSFIVNFTITDSRHLSGAARSIVINVPSNQAPIAQAGDDQTVESGNAVPLDASGSTDDGQIVKYEWFNGTTSLGTGATLSVSLAKGTHVLRLVVTDDLGATASDEVTITVSNRAPIANAGADQSVFSGTPVTLDASGSSDPDGTIVSYDWFNGTTSLGSGANLSVTLPRGVFNITLVVTDDNGATASDLVEVTVKNRPPVANASRTPAVVQCTGALTQILLDGTLSSDPEGDALSFAWSRNSIGIATGAMASVSLPRGTHSVVLTVNDGHGGSDAATTQVEVQDVSAPAVTLSANRTELWPANHKLYAVAVSASASDACDPQLTITGSVVSNEADDANGSGDGNTTGDIVVIRNAGTSSETTAESSNAAPTVSFNPLTDKLELRAERNGTGSGREYTITVTARDAAGNATTRTVVVKVPHSK